MKKRLALFLVLCLLSSALTCLSVSAENVLTLKKNSKLTLKEFYGIEVITDISEKTTVETLIGNFVSSDSITISRNGKILSADAKVATGDVVALGDDTLTVLIKGDTNGDGEVTATDYLQIKSHFLELIVLESLQFAAADTNDSLTLDSTDYLQVKSYFLGNFMLYPEETVIPEDDKSSDDTSDDTSTEPEKFIFNLEKVSLVGTTAPQLLIEGTYSGNGELFVKINGNDTKAEMAEGNFSINADITSLNEEGRWYDIHVYYTNENYVDIDTNAINYDANTALNIGSKTYKFASWENTLKVFYESTGYDPYAGIDPTIAAVLKTSTFKCEWVEDTSGEHTNGGWYPLITFQGTIPVEYRDKLGMITSIKVCYVNNDKLQASEIIAENVKWDSDFNINYSFDLTKLLKFGDKMKYEWFYIEINAQALGGMINTNISMPLGLLDENFVPDGNAGDVKDIGVYELADGTKVTFKFHYNSFDYKVLAVSYSY